MSHELFVDKSDLDPTASTDTRSLLLALLDHAQALRFHQVDAMIAALENGNYPASCKEDADIAWKFFNVAHKDLFNAMFGDTCPQPMYLERNGPGIPK